MSYLTSEGVRSGFGCGQDCRCRACRVNSSPLGEIGCGCGSDCRCAHFRRRSVRRLTICRPGCGCWRCHTLRIRLGETYEEDPPEPPPPPRRPGRSPAAKAGATAGESSGGMEGRYGEPPGGSFPLSPPTLLRPMPAPRLGPGLSLRMPPYATIDGFARNQSQLSAAQAQAVQGVARMIDASWRTASPVASLRFAAFMHHTETTPLLDAARARAVREAVIGELGALNPTLARRIRWEPDEPRGVTALVPRVEIFAWMGPTPPPPAPPAPRIPPPSEIRPPGFPRVPLPPFAPESPEERIRRILQTLPPAPPPGRSVNDRFWGEVDARLNAIMQRVGIPPSLRGPLRDGARAAIERGAEAILDQVLDAARLTGEPREAVGGTVRALLQVPIR